MDQCYSGIIYVIINDEPLDYKHKIRNQQQYNIKPFENKIFKWDLEGFLLFYFVI